MHGAAGGKLEKALESDKLFLRQQLNMKLVSGEFPKTIRQHLQDRHLPGEAWEEEKRSGNMKSVFYDGVDLQELLDKCLRTGEVVVDDEGIWTE